MFSQESHHPRTRIMDLLNPAPMSSTVLPPAATAQSMAHVPDYHSNAHGQSSLPDFRGTSAKYPYEDRASRSPPNSAGSSRMHMYGADQTRTQTQMDAAGDGRSRVQARGDSRDPVGMRSMSSEAQEHSQAQYSLRAASWESARALSMADASAAQGPAGDRNVNVDLADAAQLSHPGREYIRDGAHAPGSAPSLTDARPNSAQAATLPDSRALPPVAIPSYPSSHFAAPPAILAIPHSPFAARHQQNQGYPSSTAQIGPLSYPNHPHIANRTHLVPLATGLTSQAPASSSVSKVDDDVSMMTDIAPSYQLGDRAHMRPVAGEAREYGYQDAPSPHVLQLRPTDYTQPTRTARKRTFSEADEAAHSSSPSPYSRQNMPPSTGLSSLNTTTPPTIGNLEGSNTGSSQSLDRNRNSKSTSPPMSSDNAAKRRRSSQQRIDSEERAGDSASDRIVSIKAQSSQKGKEKTNGGFNYPYVYAPGQAAPVDPKLTSHYGVSVVPVNSTMPFMQFNPYSMHPLPPGMPVPMQGQHTGRIFPELQYARCMSARYRTDAFPRCVSCTRRWAGDTCRFQNIRTLMRDENKNLIAVGFQTLTSKSEGMEMTFPGKWNVELEKRHVDRIMETVAIALLPHLQKEVAHQKQGNVVKRQRETDVRATCDTCMTSLFSSSWICRQCGREACEECYQTICRLTADPNSAAANGKPKAGTGQRSMRERHAAANPFFLSCNRKAEHGVYTFNPVTRFEQVELEDAVQKMQRLVNGSKAAADDGTPDREEVDGGRAILDRDHEERQSIKDDGPQSPSLAYNGPSNAKSNAASQEPGKDASDSNMLSNAGSLTPDVYNDGVCTLVKNPIPPSAATPGSVHVPPSCPVDIEPPTWPVPYYTGDALVEPVFAAQWARGTPLVVTGLLHRFNLRWTPQYFIEHYGPYACIVLECQTEANKKVTVAEFFSCFGNYTGRTESWKLKDWPPSTDFKTAFPELYDDFSRAVPISNYTRRDGTLNIASHFPTNTVSPDLGPKMYNAYASNENVGTKGSTRLHMDMADAVNIMLHAELTPDGAPGCAVWDIFRAEDAAHLRAFFKRHFKGQYQNDPIHAQTFYLDTHLRAQLFAEANVRPFRIYQRPGEAVFIPAGCAHQVCNLADCVKVACDFVSPENVERCETLTREFRAQNQSLVWKEDVLQLRSMMWFAWQSCRRQQAKWWGKEEAEGGNSSVARTLATATDSAGGG